MTKIVLTEALRKTALQQYHPIINIDLWSLEQEQYESSLEEENDDIIVNGAVNIKILNADIEEMLALNSEQELEEYQRYVSNAQNDLTNVVFTPQSNTDIIIPAEYYRGVFYLQLPQFYRTISLHMLTPYFDASDNIALFTIDDIREYLNSPDVPAEAEVELYENETPLGYTQYLIQLSESLRVLESLEIDVFAQNEGIANFIGIIDENMRGYDADEIEQMYREQKTLINEDAYATDAKAKVPTTIQRNRAEDDISQFNYFDYNNIQELSLYLLPNNPDYTYESTIKYINDDLYIEEYNQRENSIDRKQELQTNDNYNYTFAEWTEE